MIASLIVLLYLAGIISTSSAITSLYIAGALLIIAEMGIISFGMVAINGLIALYAAYTIQSGSDMIFGISIGWPVLFAIAFIEIVIIAAAIAIHLRLRRNQASSGPESMIGDHATVIKWNGNKGNVRYEGEIWKAHSEEDLNLKPDARVTIQSINKLDITITQ
jgi:membrane-bound ClpP family serine protease